MDRQLIAGIFAVIVGVIGVARRKATAQAQKQWLTFWGLKGLEEEKYAIFYGILGSIFAALGAVILLSRLLP